MAVRIEVDRTAEALHEGDGVTAPSDMACRLRLVSMPALCDAQENGQHGADQRPVPGQTVADFEGKAQYPLAHRDGGKHLLGQPRCRVGHATAQARRAEAALLAGKRHHPTLTPVFAAQPQETVDEDAAFEIRAQLLLDMPGQLTIGGAQTFEEGLQVTGHGLVQRLGLRRAAAVGDGGHAAPTARGEPVVRWLSEQALSAWHAPPSGQHGQRISWTRVTVNGKKALWATRSSVPFVPLSVGEGVGAVGGDPLKRS